MSSPCQDRRSARFLVVAVAAYPPGLSKVAIGGPELWQISG
jgi:hypothetical protein